MELFCSNIYVAYILQDKCSIFSESSPRQERGYILASEGCKVLRIQKKAFYEEASDKAIRHAKALAELERLGKNSRKQCQIRAPKTLYGKWAT